MNYSEMTVKQLMEVAKEMKIKGRHGMRRDELIAAIEEKRLALAVTEVQPEPEVESAQPEVTKNNPSRRGRTRTVEVWKDGELIKTVDGLVETLKWAVEAGVSNQGWVKHSLKTGKETVAGRKFKEGGYLFKYAK